MVDDVSAGAAGATAAAALDAATDAATKAADKAADDSAKAVEAEAAPKPVVKPRRDRKVWPCTSLPLYHNSWMFGLLNAATSRIASFSILQSARSQGKPTWGLGVQPFPSS